MFFEDDIIMPVKYTCITKGDNKVTNIAAASILAKVARDLYIADLCKSEPDLDIKYGLARNMGYGTKLHMEGIAAHGISKYHRKTFGVCQKYST
jgi:ribonuclease HII